MENERNEINLPHNYTQNTCSEKDSPPSSQFAMRLLSFLISWWRSIPQEGVGAASSTRNLQILSRMPVIPVIQVPSTIFLPRYLFYRRLIQCNEDMTESKLNACISPVYNIIKAAILFRLYDDAMGMILGTKVFCKQQWKVKVWSNAWEIEKQDWNIRTELFTVTYVCMYIY